MHLGKLACILVFVVLSGFPSAAKEANWLKLRSEHFEIFSAENEKKARKVLEHLERVRKAYGLLTKVQVGDEEPVRVLLFRNEKEYRDYAPSKLAQAYYMSARGRDYIVLSDFDERTERILNHEYFHLFSRHAEFKFPVWLEEGLADFYSTLQITKKDVSLGLPVKNHLLYLNSLQGLPLPLSQIVAINHENRHEGDAEVTSRLYAQGWALTHMTFNSKEMGSRSQMFFEKIRNGEMDTAQVYQAVYGLSLERLDQMLSRYVSMAAYYYAKVPSEGLDFTAPTNTETIEDWETPLLLADMLTFVRKGDEAMQRYNALADEFPNRPEIEESRGYLAWQTGDRTKPVAFFRAAAEKKSTNPMLYFHLATLACNYQQASDECRNWINESLRLDPSNKLAREWAVGYALNTHEWAAAVTYLVRGGPVAASEAPDFFHKLAYAQYQLQSWKEAKASVKRGLEFAKKPEDKMKLADLERNIGAAEEYHTKLAEVRSGTYTATDSNQPALPSSEIDSSQPTLQQRRGIPQPSAATRSEKPLSDRVVEQFILQDGATMTAATMEAFDCGGAQPAMVVKAKGVSLRLVIDQPTAIHVIRNGEIVVDHEFVCGKQKPQALLVGYLKEGAPAGSDGLLRILSFQ